MRLIQSLTQNHQTGAQPAKVRIYIMKHNFEKRKQNRIEYAKKQAEKNERDAEAYSKAADEMASHIPLGQPILVGHHSEKSDRNYRNKIWNTYGKAAKAGKKANYYKEKAKVIESNDAIFSDDPNAIEKLDEKIALLEKQQTFMKDTNKFIRKKDKDAFLQLEGATEILWQELNQKDRFGGIGFASFELTNNSANIRRLKARRRDLQSRENMVTDTIIIKGVKVKQNVEANRLQLIFPSIPPEKVRNDLFYKYSFRWSKSEGAWQRHLNNAGFSAAKQFLQNYQEE